MRTIVARQVRVHAGGGPADIAAGMRAEGEIMPLKDVVKWLRDEHDGVNELIDALREKIARPPRGDRTVWLQELTARFDEFAAGARQRMARQQEGGYLKPVREARPALAEQVDLLEHEHAELARILGEVERAVHQLVPMDKLLLSDCCRRTEFLLGWFERHEEHENHIVLYALGQEGGSPS